MTILTTARHPRITAVRALRLLTLAVVVVGCGYLTQPGQAKVVSDPATHKVFGIVPAGRTAVAGAHRLPRVRTTACSTDCSPLLYGVAGQSAGPVQHAEHDYLFFWDPSGAIPAAYKAGLEQWLNDLVTAGANNLTPVSVTQQYYDNSGPGGATNYVQFAVQNAGSIVDTSPYPTGGCSVSGYSSCITDGQIEAELTSYISAHGLPTGTDVEYFVLTPQDVASCLDSNPADGCSYTDYCGYHSNYQPSGNGPQVIYADLPWTYGVVGCDFGPPYLNSNQTDSVVDTFSHELSESMTDPVAGTGWVDAAGNEIGDKCVALYGTTQAGPNGASYNVQLGNDLYLVQTEFSNRTSNCESSLPVPVSTALPTVSGAARQGGVLADTGGTWSNSPTSVAYQWEECDSGGANCVTLPGATGQSYQLGSADIGHRLRVSELARNSAGSSAPATSAPSAVVLPLPPANTGAPGLSGRAVEGSTLVEAPGKWSNGPTALLEKWERCDAHGGNCSPISGATGQRYQLRAADVDHTIRVSESASNAGGPGGPAVSAATAVVSPSPARVEALLQALLRANGPASQLLSRGRTSYGFSSPSAGRLTITLQRGAIAVARGTQRFSAASRGKVSVTLTSQGRAIVTGQRGPLTLELIVSFSPRTGSATTVRRSIRV